MTHRVLHEEEPFDCISCGKPFGVRSTIERIVEKLEGKHWMYTGVRQRAADPDVRRLPGERAVPPAKSRPSAWASGRACVTTADEIATRKKLN